MKKNHIVEKIKAKLKNKIAYKSIKVWHPSNGNKS